MTISFIETQFPIARLSAESYKERKAVAGQTLTGLGKWWGRKPLILARACILGMLMPASSDARKDRDIFLKILTMDDDGVWQRCTGEIPVAEWRDAASPEIRDEYFGSRGFVQGLSDQEKDEIRDRIWNVLSPEQQQALDASRRRPVPDRAEFYALSYDERIRYCYRPEQVEGPSAEAWAEINAHLGTSAGSLVELVQQLGERRFGHRPRVGDAFCGGGSIPFEAARIGCDAWGSDLNPVACLLTWASLNLLGGSKEVQQEAMRFQQQVFAEVDRQITEWGIEHNERGERADAYLYCVEVKPEGCDYYIPLAPSWVVAEKTRVVVDWQRVAGSDRLQPAVRSASVSEFKACKDGKGATVVDGRVIDPFDSSRSWSIESIRGPEGLRRWTNEDVVPRADDVLQERLYCIRWSKQVEAKNGKIRAIRRYAAPDDDDITRDDRVKKLLDGFFEDWQEHDHIPASVIPEYGDETARLYRERGWTHWHHLFTPRQLLLHGLLAATASKLNGNHSQPFVVDNLLRIGVCANWNSKLCSWDPWLSTSGGIGAFHQTFYNQALNPMINYGSKASNGLKNYLLKERPCINIGGAAKIGVLDARDLNIQCDIWVTDPPYADAVNYHELGDFFLAWQEKGIHRAFPEWATSSRAELAVRGANDDFRRSMVEIYRNLAEHMPDNGMQLVMFTHQNPAVWADLGMILWAAGLKATAAWTISTETDAVGIKKGNYVQGTVCLVLRKRTGDEAGFLDEVFPKVEDEVRRQIDAMRALDEGVEPNFNDADYQLAAYAAALKVLTQYGNIDGRDVEHEVFAVRGKGEISAFQTVIERAVTIACDYLIPRGLDAIWRDLSLPERYYLRALDVESRGERRKGMYEELARGFGLADIKPMLASGGANVTRMRSPSAFKRATLAAPETDSDSGAGSTAHPFASAPLRHLLFAMHETARNTNDPEPGRQYLRDTFGTGYWSLRERMVQLLDWLAPLAHNEAMDGWEADCEAARILAGRLRSDHA